MEEANSIVILVNSKKVIKFEKNVSKFEKDSAFNRLARGEAGQAHRDGTIEVDPNLSPLEKQKTIAHEMKHVQQMQEDGLDYDDDFVYYKGNKHRRRDGKIRYNGRWHIEGAKQLPWEAEAYAAETPLKRDPTGDNDLEALRAANPRRGGFVDDAIEYVTGYLNPYDRLVGDTAKVEQDMKDYEEYKQKVDMYKLLQDEVTSTPKYRKQASKKAKESKGGFYGSVFN